MLKTSILLGSAASVMGVALCTTGATLTSPLACATGVTAKTSASCAGDPCVAGDFAGNGVANKCCTVTFVATCGATTDGGDAFTDTDCGDGKVYDSTKAATTAPGVDTCCKDAPPTFVATCGETTDGGDAFTDTDCGDGKVYDSTKAATTAPGVDTCCKAAVAMAKCSTLADADRTCTDGTEFKGDNDCAGATCATTDVGDATTSCCAAPAPTGALCTTGADVTPTALTCGTDLTAKADTSKCVGDPCVATDYTGTGDANLCCEAAVATAKCSTLADADRTCTDGTEFKGDNDCAGATCATTDVGDATTSCCAAPAAAGPLCTTGAGLPTPLTCGTAFTAKAALTSKCAAAPCVASDYTGTGTANLCCEAKASPTDSGASSLLPNFLFAAAGLIALY